MVSLKPRDGVSWILSLRFAESGVAKQCASNALSGLPLRTMTYLRFIGVVVTAAAALVLLPSCAPQAPVPAVTRLHISTLQIICGGRVLPGVPFCRTPTSVSRAVEVGTRGQVVASGTTDSKGTLLVEVPAGTWVVTVPGAMVYEDCDRPVITAVEGLTTRVTQTCILNVP